MTEKLYVSYNQVHKLCQQAAEDIKKAGKHVDLIIAIGGGGFIPARILRSFLKEEGRKNIPIQAIGLSLYEEMGDADKIGKEVVKTQWLDLSNLAAHLDTLKGKQVLIVDEVDDTRTTLHYAVSELERDVQALGDDQPTFSVFVLHNKRKQKRAELPAEMFSSGRYIAGQDVDDIWIAYPWDAADIDEHSQRSQAQEAQVEH